MDILKRPEEFRYQLLGRCQCDCLYFLGFGNRSNHRLWAGNVPDHIETMKKLWDSVPEERKPEWLSYEEILEFEAAMMVEPA